MYISSSYPLYSPILHHKSRKSYELHVQSRSAAIFVLEDITIKMPKRKKYSTKEGLLPNYSEYAYSDIVNNFSEHDRLLELDLNSLNCSTEYQLERSLNSFKDQELNDHLHRIFYSKKNKEHYVDEEMDHVFCETVSNSNFAQGQGLS